MKQSLLVLTALTFKVHRRKLPVTYAGGVHSYEDLKILKELGNNRLNVTVGSALDLFGGKLEWKKVLELCNMDKS